MQKVFYGSICHYGIQGGAIFLNDEGVLFRCQKLSIEEKYKHLLLPYKDISKIQKSQVLGIFPCVTIDMKQKEQYKFVIFQRNLFLKEINKML